ncbi:hypothetical protein LINPERPRIM_LOCUS11716 [Linum perenne]
MVIAPMITHLIFADDTMIFIRVTRPSLVHLRSVFTRYQLLSGQRINYAKNSLLFSKNVPDDLIEEYSDFLQINSSLHTASYLGAPLCCPKIKKGDFFVSRRQSDNPLT